MSQDNILMLSAMVIFHSSLIPFVFWNCLFESQPELYNSQSPDPDPFRLQLNETQPETPMHKLAQTPYPPTASYSVATGPFGEGSMVVDWIKSPEQWLLFR